MNAADSVEIMEGKALMLKAHTKTLQAENPGWSFGRAWSRALELHPDLAENHGDEPTATPAYAAPLPSAPAQAQAKLDALLAKLNMPKKVEAKKPRSDDAELMLVEAAQRGDAMPVYSKSGVLLGEVIFD